MTIDEAIKILTILESRSTNNSTMFKKDALKLGIEALKRVNTRREKLSWEFEPLLPGETT
jgi:hypothetical protein